jgi:hypothetical protein
MDFGKSNADSSGTPYLTPPTLTRSFQFDLRHPRSFPKHSTQHHGVRLPSSHLDHLILLASSCYLYKPLFLFKLYLRQRSRFFPKNSLRTLESPIFGHFEFLPTTESINPPLHLPRLLSFYPLQDLVLQSQHPTDISATTSFLHAPSDKQTSLLRPANSGLGTTPTSSYPTKGPRTNLEETEQKHPYLTLTSSSETLSLEPETTPSRTVKNHAYEQTPSFPVRTDSSSSLQQPRIPSIVVEPAA